MVDLERVDEIIDTYNADKRWLISILLEVQGENNYLPREALVRVAERLDVHLTKVYSVATFYKGFSLKPRGKHIINACLGTACHVRGGGGIVERVKRELDIDVDETTEDGQFTLETVRCLGACALGPVMVIDGEYYGKVSSNEVHRIIDSYKEEETHTLIQLKAGCLNCGKSLMDNTLKIDGVPSVRVGIEFEGKRVRLNLSSLYGSYHISSEHEIPIDEIVKFFCPHCNHDMTIGRICERCGAPMIAHKLINGGIIQICSRRGCKKHLLEFEDLESEIRTFYDTYSNLTR